MDEPKSKTQKKRDAESLQKIGIKLVALSAEKLDRLPLSEPLKRAILEAKSLRSHGAIRRQAQLIGKLMRTADHQAIVEAYALLSAESSAQTASFHQLEQWREKLLTDGNNALTEFIAEYRPEDIQQLRQLIKKAISEKNTDKPKGAQKALFRYLRTYMS